LIIAIAARGSHADKVAGQEEEPTLRILSVALPEKL